MEFEQIKKSGVVNAFRKHLWHAGNQRYKDEYIIPAFDKAKGQVSGLWS